MQADGHGSEHLVWPVRSQAMAGLSNMLGDFKRARGLHFLVFLSQLKVEVSEREEETCPNSPGWFSNALTPAPKG